MKNVIMNLMMKIILMMNYLIYKLKYNKKFKIFNKINIKII
jgi:hypothetical protein